MASKADGTIYIDTAIETDGFVSGGKEVEAASRRMAKSVSDIGASARIALQKQTDAFIKQNQNYAHQTQKVEALKAKLKELSETQIATEEFSQIGKRIDSDVEKLNRLEKTQEDFLAVGGKKSSSAYKKRELQIDELRNSIKYAKEEQDELMASGEAYTTPDTSALEQKIASEELKATQMQTSLGTSYESLKAKVQTYEGEIPNAVQETNLLKAALLGLKMAAHAPVSAMKALGKAIISLPKKIPGLLVDGLKSLGSAARNAATAVGNKLLSGLKKAGSAILGLNKGANSSGGAFGGGLKAMLRYGIGVRSLFALVNRLRGALVDGFQNLAQYSGTTNQSISSLMSSLTQLKNSFATAFAPILNVVAPILTNFINMISRAVTYIGMFIAALTGQKTFEKAVGVQQDYAQSLANTAGSAEKAADAQDDYLSGLDEVNRFTSKDLSGGAGGGGAGGGGVSPGDMFETVNIEPISFKSWGEAFDAFLDYLLDKGIPALKNALSGMAKWINKFSSNLYEMFTFPGVLEKVQLLGKEIANAFNDFVNMIDWATLGGALGAGLNLAIQFLINAVYTFDWKNLGSSIATAVNNLISEIDWYAMGQLLWSKFKMIFELLAGFILGLDMSEVANALSQVVIGLFNSITETIQNIDWQGLGNQVKELLINIDWAGIAEAVFRAIGAAFGGAVAFLWGLIKDAWDKVVNWWHDVADGDGKNLAKGLLNGIISVFSGIGLWIKEHIFQPFIDGFKSVFGIHSPSRVMSELGNNLMFGLFNGITSLAAYIISPFLQIKDAIISVWESVKAKTSDVWNAIVATFKSPVNAVIGILNQLISGASSAVNMISDMFNSMHVDIPEWVPGIGGKSFGFNLPKWNPGRIPYLASGAVIPPNAPFMAVLGDQKQGNNIEAPESLIRRIVREESGTKQQGNVQYKFTGQINRRVLFDEMISEAELRQTISGQNPFELA